MTGLDPVDEGSEAAKSNQFYKYTPYISYVDVPRYTSVTVYRGRENTDISNLVKLGGPFEKIGEEDENVGGDSKKVG